MRWSTLAMLMMVVVFWAMIYLAASAIDTAAGIYPMP